MRKVSIKKKVVSWGLVVALAVGMVPGQAFAEGELDGAGSNGIENVAIVEAVEPVTDVELGDGQVPGEEVPSAEVPGEGDQQEALGWKITSIEEIPVQEYTGQPVRPEVVVKNGLGEVVDSSYYQVSYGENVKLGKGQVTVTGIGPYEGTVTGDFYILNEGHLPQMSIEKIASDLGRVKLEFEPLDVSGITVAIQVNAKRLEDGFSKVYEFKTKNDFVLIKGLKYNKEYEFTMRAIMISEDGNLLEEFAGPWSDHVRVYANRFGDRVQNMAKAAITKITLGKTSAKIQMKKIKLSDPDLDISYSIGYKMATDSKYKYIKTSNLTKTIYGLDKGATYDFKVRYCYDSKIDGNNVNSLWSPIKHGRIALPVSNVLNIARSWLGISEKNWAHSSIVDLYNSHEPLAVDYKVKYTDEWCATTVSAMFIKAKAAGFPGTECGVQRYIELFKQRGIWEEDGRVKPKAGYLICYNWDDSSQRGGNTGWADHIGIVEKVKGNKITVIEGNYCPKGHKYDKVARRTIPVGWGYIRGYAKLQYSTKSKVW